MTKYIRKSDQAFFQGYVCAVATLIRQHDEHVAARDMMRCLSTDMEVLKSHGCDPEDLRVIDQVLNPRRYTGKKLRYGEAK